MRNKVKDAVRLETSNNLHMDDFAFCSMHASVTDEVEDIGPQGFSPLKEHYLTLKVFTKFKCNDVQLAGQKEHEIRRLIEWLYRDIHAMTLRCMSEVNGGDARAALETLDSIAKYCKGED